MLKIIFKNLCASRSRSWWLLAEMVVVTIAIWVFVDPLTVNSYVGALPVGYDRDRLCMVKLAAEVNGRPGYRSDRDTPEALADDMLNLRNGLSNLPGVESITITGWAYPDANGSSSQTVTVDSMSLDANTFTIIPDCRFLSTYGIKALPGYPAVADLESGVKGGNDVVITRTMARLLFPGSNPVGHFIGQGSSSFNSGRAARVIGVVEDVRPRTTASTSLVMFYFESGDILPDPSEASLLIRLEEGMSVSRFIDGFKRLSRGEVSRGNVYCSGIRSYCDISAQRAYAEGVTNKNRLHVALSIFFFANLLLGTAGVFYLQTRRRSVDAGIMRSFGATPRRIMLMLLGEGWVLTTAGWLVGCLIYLQYALHEGLARANNNPEFDAYDSSWVTDFPIHFAVVSLIVYALLLLVVTLGVSVPAFRISRVSPVDALRDE